MDFPRGGSVEGTAEDAEARRHHRVGVGSDGRRDPRRERGRRKTVIHQEGQGNVEGTDTVAPRASPRETRPEESRDGGLLGRSPSPRRNPRHHGQQERPARPDHPRGRRIQAQRVHRRGDRDRSPEPVDEGRSGRHGLRNPTNAGQDIVLDAPGLLVLHLPDEIHGVLEGRSRLHELDRIPAPDPEPSVFHPGDPGGDDGRQLTLRRSPAPGAELVHLDGVEERQTTPLLPAPAEEASTHVGVEGLLLHAQAGGGFGGGESP